MESELTLVVMAAGVGSRFGGLKQLEPVGPSGEIILDYSIHDALAAGFGRVVFVIRREMERDFRELFGRRVEDVVETRYVFQEQDSLLPAGFTPPAGRVKPWGTGHAILVCRDDVEGPFVVINADDFYGASSYQNLADWFRAGQAKGGERLELAMAGFVLGKTLSEHGYVSRGVCAVSPEGELRSVREHVHIERRGGEIASLVGDDRWEPLPGDALVSMNMWGFVPGLFEELAASFETFLASRGGEQKSELYIPSVVMELLERGRARVSVIPTAERWVGVTHRDDLVAVRETIGAMVEAGRYPADLRAALAGRVGSKP